VLASGLNLVGVYTQPDRPAGRGRGLSSSPVKLCALEAGIPVYQPESLRTPTTRRELESLAPDLMVVVAYGLILTPQVLATPKAGCWNVHASILPRWRGAAPIQRALMAGDTESGVDLMQMEKGLDTGPVLLSRRTPILSSDSAGSLHDRLALLGADVLAEGLQCWQAGTLPPPRPQDEFGMSYAAKIEKHEAILDFNLSCAELERKVRAFSPWPIAETVLLGDRVRVHAALAIPGPVAAPPGTLLRSSRSGIDFACSDGILSISRLQRDGGKVVGAGDYVNARPTLFPPS
jgi:methionyl-tRNA formyltransferase